ncbi:uncharacterized protein LOC105191305 [Harpegnathos saltator]|uniref:uncharacterized protein LOC105191305 n=1 Tax=Harpegnathos saltator TaxID=610380 RepID=UPI000DBEE69E|nr:uncharacterized protein LOC105191305 [Harpegnathos saltator]XP_025153906.1 uncharacterized protein LOC105191305 [Harpegnathos saltator]XP_025153907.1 uncharacterized protein LOC105191305 [Harpegnathos saltator]
MSNTGGTPSHDYYIEGKFIRVRENGKYFVICKLCNTRLCTTAVKRLKTHRVKCSTNSNDINENDLGKKRSYSSIDGKNEDELLGNKKLLGEYDVVAGKCILIAESATSDVLHSIDTNQILPAKDVQPKFSAVVSKKPKKSTKIENFLDKVLKKDKLKIDESLTEWLLSSNLPFNTVNNPFFQNFTKVLRPAYILPSTEVLNSIWLNRVYDKWILTQLSNKNTGILLITRNRNCLNNKPSFISIIFHKPVIRMRSIHLLT